MDLYLDTHPRSDSLGVAQALHLGIPAITLLGETMPSRLAASHLKCAGLSELICLTPKQYHLQACQLAGEALRRLELRETLPKLIQERGLTDVPRFTENFQKALLSIR